MALQSIRGMRDLLPGDTPRWRHVESTTRSVIESFGYEEIRLPLLEATELFSRSVGESTDIVEKEMYSLSDRDGVSISLRPEGTAGCVRACLQHGLIFNQPQRLWYAGPMFRYERPQKGRYRQFDQIGVEAFGMSGPEQDAELVQLAARVFHALGLATAVQLQLNTLGTPAARAAHRVALVEWLSPRRDALDADSRRRLDTNPLRILDSKDPGTQALLAQAPKLEDYLDDAARAHFDELCVLLDKLQIGYVVNRRLVRGLDYYTHTVFEWVTDALGAQGTVCAGGRYDGLVEQLGGRPTPGAGFAFGVDRLVLLHEAVHPTWLDRPLDVYGIVMAPEQQAWAMAVLQQLRSELPGLRVRLDTQGGKLKNQLKRADASGAACAAIFGAEEREHDQVSVKWLRSVQPQARLDVRMLAQQLAQAGLTGAQRVMQPNEHHSESDGGSADGDG
jgi:histidyl-tRNA synthetase